ncbi:MAG: thiamine-phosphate kinase [Desulfobulbaceae bacterium]
MDERELIAFLRGRTVREAPGLLRGIGDDCAVLADGGGGCRLVTMDTLVESVHFDLRWHPPDKLGRKTVSVNVSDIAAMGGRPLFVFLSLGLPQDFASAWVHEFFGGLEEACSEYGCLLVGGDTVRSPDGVLVTVTVIGEMKASEVVYRSTARPGDIVWVSGSLGMAAAGLKLCKKGRGDAAAGFDALVNAHLDPSARLRLGRVLAEKRVARSMMDISDGLATDLSHLCVESGVGALIHGDRLPVSGAVRDAARLLGCDPLDLALRGGEDYELLFTAPAGKEDVVREITEETGVDLTPVGVIDDLPGVRLVPSGAVGEDAVDISFTGYDHFRR